MWLPVLLGAGYPDPGPAYPPSGMQVCGERALVSVLVHPLAGPVTLGLIIYPSWTSGYPVVAQSPALPWPWCRLDRWFLYLCVAASHLGWFGGTYWDHS